jgi:hypothetical protein
MVQFAIIMNITKIFVDKPFLLLPLDATFDTLEGINVKVILSSAHIPYPSEQWIDAGWLETAANCPELGWHYIADSIRPGLLPLLPSYPLDSEALYLYLRGGQEIWKKGAHPNYLQPPCRFYLDAMQIFSKVFVLGGDENPCRQVVIDAGAIEVPFDDLSNVMRLVYARNVALARSSRSHVVLALSPERKTAWLFDQVFEKKKQNMWWYGYDPRAFADGMNCVPPPNFVTVTAHWEANSEQSALIRTANCSWVPLESLQL